MDYKFQMLVIKPSSLKYMNYVLSAFILSPVPLPQECPGYDTKQI